MALGCALALHAGAAEVAVMPGLDMLRNDILPAEISFDGSENSPLSNPRQVPPITFGKHSDNWTSLGNGRYTEDFITTMFRVPNYTWEVEYQENVDEPGVYRIVNPFGTGCPYIDGEGVEFSIIVNAKDPDKVYVETVETTLDLGLGPITFSSWASYYMEKNEDVPDNYYGTMRDGVIIFPFKYLLVRMRDYYSNSAFYANCNRKAVFRLPGSKEYSLEISNDLLPDDPTHAVLNYTSSTDFYKISYVFRKAYDNTNYYGLNEKSFVQAREEGLELTQGEGSLEFDLTELGRGKYLCYMSGYTEDGAIMARATTDFFYDGDNSSEWQNVGTSKFTEDIFSGLFGVKNSTWEVETQQNKNDYGYFRLVNPYKDFKPTSVTTYDDAHDYYIYLHIYPLRKVPVAYIEESLIGADFGYGMAKVSSTPSVYNMWGNSWESIENFHGTMPLFAEYDEDKHKVTFIKEHAWFSMPRYQGGEFTMSNPKGKLAIVLPASAGIDDVVVDDVDAPAEYFDLNGRPVSTDNMSTGIFIERRGATVKKIAVTR